MKIKLKSILTSALFDLEPAIEIRQVHKRFIKLVITYNTIILPRHAIQFLDLNVLYISKVLAFLDYILSLAKARDKNFITLRIKITVYINSYYDLNKKCE